MSCWSVDAKADNVSVDTKAATVRAPSLPRSIGRVVTRKSVDAPQPYEVLREILSLNRWMQYARWTRPPLRRPVASASAADQSGGSGSTSSMVQLLSELRLATMVQLPERMLRPPPAQIPPTQPLPDESTLKTLVVL